MDAAHTIREAVSKVFELRALSVANPPLKAAISEIKRFQARRFAATYADILNDGPYRGAAKFFLEELYGEKDYTHRDAQYARIAGAMQKLLPKQALNTAILLARVHLLTEELDHAMGLAWLKRGANSPMPGTAVTSPAGFDVGNSGKNTALRYAYAWQDVGRKEDRRMQLNSVLNVGHDLDRLTRAPGLRLMLKMMRRPAEAAGLSDLQRFLENGFDTFAAIGNRHHDVKVFLSLVGQRENQLIEDLFAQTPEAIATQLALD